MELFSSSWSVLTLGCLGATSISAFGGLDAAAANAIGMTNSTTEAAAGEARKRILVLKSK